MPTVAALTSVNFDPASRALVLPSLSLTKRRIPCANGGADLLWLLHRHGPYRNLKCTRSVGSVSVARSNYRPRAIYRRWRLFKSGHDFSSFIGAMFSRIFLCARLGEEARLTAAPKVGRG
jgi:hypothetical protein